MTSDMITDLDQLRALYRPPNAAAAGKVTSRIDDASARFIAASPFVMLATADPDGHCDVSPRGGPPGSCACSTSVTSRCRTSAATTGSSPGPTSSPPSAGPAVIVPGRPETVRINGPAWLTTSVEVLDAAHPDLRRPKTAPVVEAAELFAHCAKAFRRSSVWEPDTWAALADAPDLAEIFACQFGGDETGYRGDLSEAYAASLAADRREAG